MLVRVNLGRCILSLTIANLTVGAHVTNLTISLACQVYRQKPSTEGSADLPWQRSTEPSKGHEHDLHEFRSIMHLCIRVRVWHIYMCIKGMSTT